MSVVIGLVYIARATPGSSPAYQNLHDAFAGSGAVPAAAASQSHCAETVAGELLVAVLVALWTYDGWNTLNYVTSEVVLREDGLHS